MYGVIDGAYYCNQDRNMELNVRIAERNIPSASLEPQFSIRPVSTKYALLPVVDRRSKSTVPINKMEPYSVENVFNPGTSQGPWNGFATNINEESKLRNQFFALQNCEQAAWVPSSQSDLYKVNVEGRTEIQPFPHLFTTEKFAPFEPNTDGLSKDIWGNHTRQQLKNKK